MTSLLAGTDHRRARRRTLGAGIVVVIVYALLAAASGRLSPLAKGPLLDGSGTLQPYKWVCPPADLATGNIKPSSAVKELTIGSQGTLAQALPTSDGQVTVIVLDRAIPPHGSDTGVRFKIEPLCPDTLAPPGGGVVTFGNVYRLSATYEPSGAKVTSVVKPIDVILVYPATASLSSNSHLIYSSTDGENWTKRSSVDTHLMQQVEAKVPSLGYVQVAGALSPAITPAPGSSSGGSGNLRIILIVAAVCVLLIGVGLILRSR